MGADWRAGFSKVHEVDWNIFTEVSTTSAGSFHCGTRDEYAPRLRWEVGLLGVEARVLKAERDGRDENVGCTPYESPPIL